MIALEGIGHSWDGGGSWVVDDVDLTVAAGELVALVGESGSGKTTTMRMINRMVVPTRGVVRVDGADVAGVDAVQLRRGIGYVVQGVALFPHLTIAENVAVVPRLLRWAPDRITARVVELMDLVQLPGALRGRRPSQLSGGQRQRVGVARALAAKPSILLMDEPFGALDPVTRDALQRELSAIHRRLGLTTVLVTHDMTEALLLADRVAVMQGGRLVRVGTPAEILQDPDHAYVAALMEAPRRHARVVEQLLETR